MPIGNPELDFDGRFSELGSEPTPWNTVRAALAKADIFWVSTVRRDGRPHVTPLLGLWLDDALYFGTGPEEQKARNLERNARCVLTTGCNSYTEGLDVVVEGTAVRVTDPDRLRRLAETWTARFGPQWQFSLGDGVLLLRETGQVLLFEMAADKVLAFQRAPYIQTVYRF